MPMSELAQLAVGQAAHAQLGRGASSPPPAASCSSDPPSSCTNPTPRRLPLLPLAPPNSRPPMASVGSRGGIPSGFSSGATPQTHYGRPRPVTTHGTATGGLPPSPSHPFDTPVSKKLPASIFATLAAPVILPCRSHVPKCLAEHAKLRHSRAILSSYLTFPLQHTSVGCHPFVLFPHSSHERCPGTCLACKPLWMRCYKPFFSLKHIYSTVRANTNTTGVWAPGGPRTAWLCSRYRSSPHSLPPGRYPAGGPPQPPPAALVCWLPCLLLLLLLLLAFCLMQQPSGLHPDVQGISQLCRQMGDELGSSECPLACLPAHLPVSSLLLTVCLPACVPTAWCQPDSPFRCRPCTAPQVIPHVSTWHVLASIV
jgi:hypothetical protein